MKKIIAMLLAAAIAVVATAPALADGDTFIYERGATSLENTLPPSPEPASAVKYVDVPFNHSLGRAELDIKVYTVRGRELIIPIELLYSSGGIRLEEVAGVAGLGWTLSAGGCVTRTVVDMPDEFSSASFSHVLPAGALLSDLENRTETTASMAYLRNVLSHYIDSSLDRYSYSICGLQGNFLILDDGSVFHLSGDGVTITPHLNNTGSIDSFTIVGPDGTKYSLSVKETGKHMGRFQEPTPTSGQPDEWEATTAWLLTSIESASGLETANFSYSDGGTWDRSIYCVTDQASIRREGPYQTISTSVEADYLVSRYDTKVLSSIALDGYTVSFSYSSDTGYGRHITGGGIDAQNYPRRLTGVSVGYEGSSLMSLEVGTEKSVRDGRIILSNLKYRHSGNLNDRWDFAYATRNYEVSVYSQDWYGYYNGENETIGEPRIRKCPFSMDGSTGAISLQWGTPDSSAAAYMSLVSANHDGATTEFEYEGATIQSGSATYSVGVRVKSIKVLDNGTLVRKRNFTYSSPLADGPLAPTQAMYTNIGVKESQTPTHLVPTQTYTWSISLHGSPVQDGRNIQQTRLLYGSVSEEDTDGNSSHGALTRYSFDATSARASWTGTSERFPSEWNWLYNSSTYAPSNPNPWWGVKEGYYDDGVERPVLLTLKQTYSWNGSSHVLKESESYTYDSQTVRTALVDYKATRVCERYLSGDIRYEDIYHYPVRVRDYSGRNIVRIERTYYHDDGGSDTDVVTYTYLARGDLSKPSRVHTETVTGGDRTRYVSYTYPDTWNGAQYGWIASLVTRHMLTDVLKTEWGTVSSGTHTPWTVVTKEYDTFELPAGPIVLMPSRSIESIGGTESWREEVLSRDCLGNPSSIKATGSPVTSIIWSYNGLYPVAVLENVNWEQVIQQFGGEYDVNDITTAATLSSYNAAELNALRNAYPTTLVSTFEYSPGKGVCRQTNPSGIVTSFDYDAAGRLTTIKDKDGHATESYTYNLLNNGGRRHIRHKLFRTPDGSSSTEDVRWWNTLGMVTEDIAIEGAGDGRDLVSAYEGDYHLHDDVKCWLPYPVSGTAGQFVSGAASQSASWHGNTKAYALKQYEDSARDIVTRTAAPGYAGVHDGTFSINSVSSFPLFVRNSPSGAISQSSWPSGTIYREDTQDADGRTSSTYKDRRGRVLAHQIGSAQPAYYIYDPHDRLSVVAGPGTNIADTLNMWRYRYDSKGRLSSKGIPGAATESYAYDSEDRIVKVKRADGTTDTSYDALGRVVSVYYTPSGGTPVVAEEHGWDSESSAATALMVSAGEPVAWSGPVKGFETWTRLAQTDGDGSVDGYVQKAMRYDGFGRLACVATLYPDGGILKEKYTYEFWGDIWHKVTTYKHGTVTDILEQYYGYDNRGRYTYINSTLINNTGTVLSDDNMQFSYDALGREASVTSESYYGVSGRLTTTTSYSLQGFPREIKAIYDNATVYDELLNYDGTPTVSGTPASYAGLITGRTETIARPGASSLVRTQGFVYDAQGRLITVKTPSEGDNSYTYDDRGNIITSSVSGGLSSQTYSYSGDRVQSLAGGGHSYQFSYDSMGRMTYDGQAGNIITYNRLGLPAKISTAGGAVLAKYSYLSDGMKTDALKADGSGFVYRGSLKYSRSAGGVLSLVGAEIPSGMLTPGGPCFEVKDHLGSVVYEIAAASGDYADGALYGEWGSHEALSVGASSATSRRHYTGKEDQWPDFAVPYTDFGARHYSPALRGWLTPDPLSEKYYTSSPYAYCAGNPINLMDPDGRKIIFINGYPKRWTGAAGTGGFAYWTPDGTFVRAAEKVFGDYNTLFPNIDYSFWSSAKQRRNDGYQYAKGVFNTITDGLVDGETIKFVSHSMGAAFAEGMADYLIEQGVPVQALIHFEPYQSARIESNGKSDHILTIDYQDEGDWIIKYVSGGDMPGADFHIKANSGSGWNYVHAHSIGRSATWDEISYYILSFLNKYDNEK